MMDQRLSVETQERLTSLFVCTVACALFIFIPFRLRDADSFGIPKELLVEALAGGIWLIVAAAASRGVGRRSRLFETCAMLACLLGFASAGAGTNRWLALRSLGGMLLVLTLLWSAARLERTLAERVARWTAMLLLVSAMAALAQAIGLLADPSPPGYSPGAFVGNRNMAAELALFALPVVWVGLFSPPRLLRAAYFIAVAVLASAITLSRSRTAWICATFLIASLAVAAVWAPAIRRARVVASILLFAGALLGVGAAIVLPTHLAWSAQHPWRESASRMMDVSQGSGRGRLLQAQTGARLVVDHPLLGVGPGNWSVEYSRYATVGDPSVDFSRTQPVARIPQSDWVGYMAETGLPFMGLVVCVLVGGLWTAVGRARIARRNEEPDAGAQYLASVALACLIATIAVAGFADPVLHQVPTATVIGVVTGCLLACSSDQKASDTIGVSRWTGVALRVVGYANVTILVLAATTNAGRIVAATMLDHVRGIHDVETATRYDPGNFVAHIDAASYWIHVRNCAAANPHLRAAKGLLPNAPSVALLSSVCDSSVLQVGKSE